MRSFKSPGAFAAFLAERRATIAEAEHRGLETGAKRIEARAKVIVGHYQSAVGPFPAWAPLAEATKTDRIRLGFTPNDPGLRTGEMRDSISHTVDGHRAFVGSDDQNLVWFEQGTSKQPPRPVLGDAAFLEGKAAAKDIGRSVAYHIVGRAVPKD